jgi:hypothetical protein
MADLDLDQIREDMRNVITQDRALAKVLDLCVEVALLRDLVSLAWIARADRMPKIGQRVQVYGPDGKATGEYVPGSNRRAVDTWTHWRPVAEGEASRG